MYLEISITGQEYPVSNLAFKNGEEGCSLHL